MFDATGNRATLLGLRITLIAMLALLALKFAQIVLYWLHDGEMVPTIDKWPVTEWVNVLLVVPLILVALLGGVAGSWFCFQGTRYTWAKRFALGAMAAFTVTILLRIISLAMIFIPALYESLGMYGLGSKSTGLLLVGMGLYHYYLLALEVGDEFPDGFGYRGGRVLLVPLAPILAGGLFAYRGDYFVYDLASWAVLVAAGLIAYLTYLRVLSQGSVEELPAKETPAE